VIAIELTTHTPTDEKKMKEFFFAPATADEMTLWMRALHESIFYANPALFGVDLRIAIFKANEPIPMVVRLCFNYLAAHFKTEGLFRVSGVAADVTAWKQAFDNAGDKFPDLTTCSDPHVITTLVKLYFRELPNPLCTFPLYPHFIEASKENSQREQVARVQQLLQQMPPEHRNTLQLLLKFLRDVASHADENKMSTPNLAAVFGPTILRAHQPSPADASNNENIVAITCTMIKYWEACYGIADIGTVPDAAGEAIPVGAAPVSDGVEEQLAAQSAAAAAASAAAASAAVIESDDADMPDHDDAPADVDDGGAAAAAEPVAASTAAVANGGDDAPAEKKKPLWKEYKTKEGKVYYFNTETKKTQWTRPPEMDEEAPEPPKPRHVGPQFKLGIDPAAVQLKKREPPARTQPAAAPATRANVAPPTRGPAPAVGGAPPAAAPAAAPAASAPAPAAAPSSAPPASAPPAAAAAPVAAQPVQPAAQPVQPTGPVRRANVAPPAVGTQPDRRPKLPPGAVAIGGPPVVIGMSSGAPLLSPTRGGGGENRESSGHAPMMGGGGGVGGGGGGDDDARLRALEDQLRALEEKQDENAALLTKILEVLGS
jgi:hypothetical protein